MNNTIQTTNSSNQNYENKSDRPRLRLGDLLTESGLINKKTLQEALNLQKEKKKKIGQILIDMQVINDVDIARALSQQLRIPFLRLEKKTEIPESIINLVPAEMAEHYLLIPVKEENNQLVVAMVNPLEFYAVDDLRFITGKDICIAVAPQTDVFNALAKHYPKPGIEKRLAEELDSGGDIQIVRPVEEQDIDPNKLKHIVELPPVVRFTNNIIADAIGRKASDIHIEPQKASVIVRYRIDGVMQEIMRVDKHVHASLVSRLKVMANMDISIRRKPQDGKAQIVLKNKNYDLRVSALPLSYGEKLTIRILDKESVKLSLGDIGFTGTLLQNLEDALDRPQGMIIVTGPTGSGKSSTLNTFLHKLNTSSVNIVTVEDPVEYEIKGINQVQINPATGLTFAAGLRSILRQDPDIVMVGEIRDSETAVIACQAAQTGHLVLSTLHTNDAPSAIPRFMDLDVDAFVLSDSLVAVIAQRLVRKICPECKAPHPLSERLLRYIPDQFTENRQLTFFKGKGCETCRYSGYSGRLGIFEILMVTPSVRQIIQPGVSALALTEAASKEGFQPMIIDGINKAAQGLTTIEEVFRVAPPEIEETATPVMDSATITEEMGTAENEDFNMMASISSIAPKKILVVDDNDIMLTIIVNTLESENYLTITATNGFDALKLAFQEKPDLILIDYMMPKMDGITLVKKLKAELSTCFIPLIMLTAKNEVDTEVAAIGAGVEDYLTKPINAKRFLARVRRIFNRHCTREE